MDLPTFLAHSPSFDGYSGLQEFASRWEHRRVEKGDYLSRQQEPEMGEFILLRGCLVSTILGHDGTEICVGLFVGPCVITPNVARTKDGLSHVSIVATRAALVARIDRELLSDLMIECEPVRDWANGVLQETLTQKGDREWCLAALGGADRLAWFRDAFAGYESIFAHTLIASFLGVTPVTMSRLRKTSERS